MFEIIFRTLEKFTLLITNEFLIDIYVLVS